MALLAVLPDHDRMEFDPPRPLQVLVVGAGPAGLVAALTLGRYGSEVLLVDKREHTSLLSRALLVSTRSMELLRSWGLEDAVRGLAADVEPRAWVAPTLASREGTELPLGAPTAVEAARVSPTRPAWIPQNELEPLLLDLVRSIPNVTVRFGWTLTGLERGPDRVRAELRGPRSQPARVEVGYVIGADGAHSTVRSLLGVEMAGPDALDEYDRVEFRAPLTDVVGDRRYGLYVITHPDARGVLAPRGRGDRWGFSREHPIGSRPFSEYSDGELRRLLRTAAGAPTLPVEFERSSSFRFSTQIADRYQEGRCFLIGDAVHRMTPRGGTGMNTAIADGYDIGWKMGWVLASWAAPELLDSYELERRPVGVHNVQRSGRADGARSEAADALPWDLNGRLAHHWVSSDQGRVSTLDLLDDGLTLLVRVPHPGWAKAVEAVGARVPITVRSLPDEVAAALGIIPGGAMLVRPDGQCAGTWTERPSWLGVENLSLR